MIQITATYVYTELQEECEVNISNVFGLVFHISIL